MTTIQSAEPARPTSPWLSVWFSPGATIERILATNPRRHVLLLAAGFGALYLVSNFAAAAPFAFGWGAAALLLFLGAALGIVNLYFSGLVFRWIGKPLGGRASPVEMRAACAWSLVPTIVGSLVITTVLFLQSAPKRAANALIIVLGLIAIVVGLWTLIATMVMLARVQRFGVWRTVANGVLAYALLFTFPVLLRSFIFQPFNAPSVAMEPTLLRGDYFFVSKFRYGYTRYSLPYSPPLFSGRVWASEPQRGDVVVFRLPRDDSTDYLKRIVGLPGDRIQMIDGVLNINGEAVKREQIANFVGEHPCQFGSDNRTAGVKRWRETLPNGVSYETLDCADRGSLDNTRVYTVPAGHYFMMGDNRDNSTDSRVPVTQGGVDYVPFANLIGRVETIYLSVDEDSGTGTLRSERLGMMVR
jgi:signal peptidase I